MLEEPIEDEVWPLWSILIRIDANKLQTIASFWTKAYHIQELLAKKWSHLKQGVVFIYFKQHTVYSFDGWMFFT